MRIPSSIITVLSAVLPVAAFAQSVTPPSNFSGLVANIIDVMGILVIVVFSLTFLVFAWGVIKGWVMNGGDSEGVESGKKVVTAAIIALVVMVSVWGILYMLKASLFGGA